MAPRFQQGRPQTQKTNDPLAALAQPLRRHPLSEQEARDYLVSAGFVDSDIDVALALARDSGWIGDATFARLWIEDRLAHHPVSRRAIEEELRSRKVSRDAIAAALNEHYPVEKESEIALAVVQTRLARLTSLDEETRRRRATDFLLRRGFSSSIASGSVRRALREER